MSFAHRLKKRWISKTWINNLEAYCRMDRSSTTDATVWAVTLYSISGSAMIMDGVYRKSVNLYQPFKSTGSPAQYGIAKNPN